MINGPLTSASQMARDEPTGVEPQLRSFQGPHLIRARREMIDVTGILTGSWGRFAAQDRMVSGRCMKTGWTASHGTASRRAEPPNLDEVRERELLFRVRSAGAEGQAALTELWMSHGKLVAAIAAKYR